MRFIAARTLLGWAAFLPLAGFSFYRLSEYNFLPANGIFDVVFICAIMLSAGGSRRAQTYIPICGLLFYLAFQAVHFSAYSPVGLWSDFLVAHKVFFYLAGFSLVAGQKVFDPRLLSWIRRCLPPLFLLKYGAVSVYYPTERPGFFTENNFEILLLLFIYISGLVQGQKLTIIEIIMMVLIVFLSSSRSAIIMLTFFAVMWDFRSSGVGWRSKAILVACLLPLAMVMVSGRTPELGIEDIDRVKFLAAFLRESASWDLRGWLLGQPALTPISIEEIEKTFLVYYIPSFSDYDKLLGFSVLFHSFLLRCIWDHGLIGMLFIHFYIYHLLRLCGANVRESAVITGILILNGASVSSLNSVYSAIGLLFIITGLNERRQVQQRGSEGRQSHQYTGSRMNQSGAKKIP